MQLSDVQHQDQPLDRLQRAMSAGRMPHAYIFSGPEGIGKELTAARLAAVLLCSSPTTKKASTGREWRDACGKCVDCELMQAGNHPDFHRIYRTLNKVHPDSGVQKRKAVELSIEVIRYFLIDKIGMRPSRDRAKVYVITEADRLNPYSQNAILKTLEEPPEHSYLILLTPSADSLLDTTRSRCQQIGFNLLPADFIQDKLVRDHGATPAAARFLSELAQGSAGRAIQYLQLGLHESAPALLEGLSRAGADPLSFGNLLQDMAKKLAVRLRSGAGKDEGDDDDTADTNLSRLGQTIVLSVTSAILRDVMRLAAGAEAVALPGDSTTRSLASTSNAERIRSAIKAVNSAEYQIGRNVNAGLIFDNVGLSVGRSLQRAAARV